MQAKPKKKKKAMHGSDSEAESEDESDVSGDDWAPKVRPSQIAWGSVISD